MDIFFTHQLNYDLDVDSLRAKFDKTVSRMDIKYAYSESSAIRIIREFIKFIDNVNSKFLGKINNSVLPSQETDHFFNNIYRYINSIETLASIWGINLNKYDPIEMLRDIRTIIVHSGEKVSNLKSINLKEYKDYQLGVIYENDSIMYQLHNFNPNFDYVISIWLDKQKKKKRKNDFDIDLTNENYKTVIIYLSIDDIKKCLNYYLYMLLEGGELDFDKFQVKPLVEEIKEKTVENLDFDKIASLIKNSSRGGYFIEQGKANWNGYGLKKLVDYINVKNNISSRTKSIVESVIRKRVYNYWDEYNDVSIDDNDLPSLDIRVVFDYCIPPKIKSNYIYSEKLFNNISTSFNTQGLNGISDIDYLINFLKLVSSTTNLDIDLENSVDGVICDFFVKCIDDFEY